LELVANFSKKE